MPPEQLSYLDYVKEAFHLKVRLPVLGWMPLNKLILGGFGILGFGLPPLWLLGLAYETAYLLYLPGNERFQKLVRGRRLAATREEWSVKEQDLLARLDQGAQLRYHQLANRCWRILHPGEQGSALSGMEDLKAGDLNHLLWIFLNLLISQKKIHEILDHTMQEDLDGEIKSLQKKLEKEAPESPVARSLKGIIEIQQRRLENQSKASESLKVTEAELYRIEKQISLIQEEVAVTKDPEVLSARLDSVVKSLQGTTEWMAENAEFFSTLAESPAPATIIPSPPLTDEKSATSTKSGPRKIAQ